jgi:hypothetical protein
MGKFTNLQANVFSIFDSVAWKAENIKTFPTNFTISGQGNEFIRVTIVSGTYGLNLRSVAGILLIDIFTSAGNGPGSTSLIADKLDQYLVGKSITTQAQVVTQFSTSSLTNIGIDKDNPALYRSSYTISFNYFGV